MHQLNAIVRSLPMEIWPLRRNRPWSDLSKTRRRWPRAATPPGLTGGQRWIGRTAGVVFLHGKTTLCDFYWIFRAVNPIETHSESIGNVCR